REYRHLDCDVFRLFLQSRSISHLTDLMSDNDFCCKRNDRDACHLADIRNGTGGSWIHLDDVHFFPANNELNVNHTDDIQSSGKSSCVLFDLPLCYCGNALGRVNGDTVSGVNTGSFDMLHNTRNQDIFSVAHRVNLDLFSHQVLVYQNRMLLCDPVDDSDKLVDIMVVDGDLHALAAKNVGRSYKNRIT